MKTTPRKIVLVSLLCGVAGSYAWAQNDEPAMPAPPPVSAPSVAPTPPRAIVPHAVPAPPAVPLPPDPARYGISGGYGGRYGGRGNGVAMGMAPFQGRTGQFLVVPGPETEGNRIASIEEDLAIMSHLLERAAGDNAQDVLFNSAMNVPLHSWGPQRMVRGLYLDGYGAVFILNVRFPLVSSPADVEKPKPSPNSNWERSKQEVFGPPDRDVFIGANNPFASSQEGYDQKKVEELQRHLLESLKEAVNMRELKANEMIVVAVIGAKSLQPNLGDLGVMSHQADTGSTGVGRGSGPRIVAHSTEDSVLSLRVKKADVDAFNKGDLSFEQFRQKAVITVN